MFLQYCVLAFSFFNLFHHQSNKNDSSDKLKPVEMIKRETDEIIPREMFFQNPFVEQPVLSPNGNYIAYKRRIDDQQNICVMDLETRDETLISLEEQGRIKHLCWANNSRIVFSLLSYQDDAETLYGVNIDDSYLSNLSTFLNDSQSQFINPLFSDDNKIIIALKQGGCTCFDLYFLDVYSGAIELLKKNPGNICRWVTNKTGDVFLGQALDGKKVKLIYQKYNKDQWIDVTECALDHRIEPVGISNNGKRVYYLTNSDRDTIALKSQKMSFPYGSKTIVKNKHWDISSWYWSKNEGAPIGVKYEKDYPEYKYLAFKWKAMDLFMKERYPEWRYSVVSLDEEENRAILLCYADTKANAFYLYDFKQDALEKLYDVYPGIDNKLLAKTKAITFRSKDKSDLLGYITFPKDERTEKFPLMVHAHVGPEERECWGYDPYVQFLANRGYAVLQINYRGSKGFGQKFLSKGIKHWDRIQGDIASGVKWAIRNGIADPEKIGIYGEGFGGLSALLGIIRYPELYCLGVDFFGPTNLFTILEELPPESTYAEQMIFDKIGNPSLDMKYLKSISPLFHVDKIKVPILIAHGGKDPKVDVSHSIDLYEALKDRNIEVKYLYKPDEKRDFLKEENRFFLASQLELFLRKHLGGYYWEATEVVE